MRVRSARILRVAAALAALAVVSGPAARADDAAPACGRPVLVLAAMPLELNPLVAATELDADGTVRVDGRTFYRGRLAGVDVVLAMTGIGLVNATETVTAAVEGLGCDFAAILFSGVAGSRHNIGDVAVPARWTLDDGDSWIDVDRDLLDVASALQADGAVTLAQDVPVGDAACLCPGVDAATPVRMPQPAKVYVGGDGMSSDMFGDKAVPCLPGGGDVAGCQPCITDPGLGEDAAAFAANAPDMADPAFFQAFFRPPAKTTQERDAQDMETAAVALVAHERGVPFLGVRAASDGNGDPLLLPGFPVQLFAYRQLAGNNAAAVTIAFLPLFSGAGEATDAAEAPPSLPALGLVVAAPSTPEPVSDVVPSRDSALPSPTRRRDHGSTAADGTTATVPDATAAGPAAEPAPRAVPSAGAARDAAAPVSDQPARAARTLPAVVAFGALASAATLVVRRRPRTTA